MQKWLEKGFLFGLGAFSITKEKAEKIKDQIIKQGELGQQEADEFIERLVKKGEEQKQELKDMINEQSKKTFNDLNLVTREEYNALLERVESLEKLQANNKNQAD
ncbi:phasin family protein [Desulfuribacillus alkaliarsenatis]|uniref:Polyhydroxyalkanoate synthesis regulator n=1 Tax=Desulfuribacillus alkaliarsenatis TaxID=766136 RepID=A0A1E5G0T5_9FIRM|nr:hypothetical protein [Desulfuribacillus alkaliarsenatis]OEF96058.1 hypothetical protein BHF68_09975 [Desulfuribacillus alkaliarsenatis]